MDAMQLALSGKLVYLNVYFDDLMYTRIEEDAKLTMIDLIAGMGGTLLKFFISETLAKYS
jgi:hypothetical protein